MLKVIKSTAALLAYKVYFPLFLLLIAYDGSKPFVEQPFFRDVPFIIVFAVYVFADAFLAPLLKPPARPEPPPDKQVDQANLTMVVAAVRTVLIVSVFEHAKIHVLPPATTLLAIAGSVAMFCGMMLRILSIRAIARYYTAHMRAESDQEIIRGGAYKYIRHPMYSGRLLFVFGFALGLFSVAGMAVALGFLFPAYLRWAMKEERLLLSSLGERYAKYVKETKRFIPFVF